MPTQRIKVLQGLRNKRDLRAEILDLAATLGPSAPGRLEIVAPVIAVQTVQAEWDRLLPALAADIRERMKLVIVTPPAPSATTTANRAADELATLPRPNYRFEILRLLIDANLEGKTRTRQQDLIDRIGASQTPIRAALSDLKKAGLLSPGAPALNVPPEQLTVELLAKVQALPRTLRFRFERGAQIKPPAMLLKRAIQLLQPDASKEWKPMALSGVPVAQAAVPQLDLIGLPRLDMVAHLGRDMETFDATLLRQIDDGLEPEPNVLAPAPVIVWIVRTETPLHHDAAIDNARCASRGDVLLSLLDMGLREQAIQYVNGVRT